MFDAIVARLVGPGTLVWENETLDPSALQPDQIFARTLYSAISPGTEGAAYSGAPPLRPMKIYPRLVGYCNVARVEAVSADAKSVKVGDIIVTHQSHRSAFVCREADVLCRVDPDFDLAQVSTSYLFHLGYAAVLRSNMRAGSKLAVIGLGAIGLGTIGVAALGGADVTGFSNQPQVAARAIALGASNLISKGSTDAELASLFDIVVSTSNSWDDWALALRIARTGGTIAVLGFPGRGLPAPEQNPLASQYFYDKQLTIVACGSVPRAAPGDQETPHTMQRNMEWLVNRVGRGELKSSAIVTEIVPASELDSVYQRLTRREGDLSTVVLKW